MNFFQLLNGDNNFSEYAIAYSYYTLKSRIPNLGQGVRTYQNNKAMFIWSGCNFNRIE